jgi:hypothetical protein
MGYLSHLKNPTSQISENDTPIHENTQKLRCFRTIERIHIKFGNKLPSLD